MQRWLRITRAGRIRTAFMAALLLLAATPDATASDHGGGSPPGLRLSAHEVVINGRLRILGRGLAALQGLYRVTVGGATAWPDRWTDTEIGFSVPAAEPGPEPVVLEPKAVDGPRIEVGTVEVGKAVPPRPGVEIVPGTVLVRIAPGVDIGDVLIGDDTAERLFTDEESDARLTRWYKVQVPVGTEAVRIDAYAARADVEVAESDGFGTAARVPSDPAYGRATQWNVRQARLTAAWEVHTTGVAIAVIDDGVRPTHEELQGLVLVNRDMTGTNLNPCDSHGTHVAATAAGRANNQVGIAGAAWSTGIGSYKVFGFAGNCRKTQWALVANAINAAVNDRFGVINMSLSGTFGAGLEDQKVTVANAINHAWAAGATLVAAAGNDNTSTPQYPAAYDHVLAVANSTQTDGRYVGTLSSNWGDWVDVAAPGTDIYSATAGSDTGYASFTGTSFASPLVAGLASLLRARGRNNVDTYNAIKDTTDPIDWGSTPIEKGRVNAYRAITARPCVRDAPSGTWVQFPDLRVFHVVSPGVVRQVPHMPVLTSWQATADWVPLCAERAAEMAIDPRPWGYRPGKLVRNPANGWIYLISTDGDDRGLPHKRFITDPAVFSCFGWSFANYVDDTYGDLAAHPEGPPISSCTPAKRDFPNGSVVRSDQSGIIFVVEDGAKRPVYDWATYTSWFTPAEWLPAGELELSLHRDGQPWGFRQGRLFATTGSPTVYHVGNEGLNATGKARPFADWNALAERGYGPVAVTFDQSFVIYGVHGFGDSIQNANNLP